MPSNLDPKLQLLNLVPDFKLKSWLGEFYGKSVKIVKTEVLRHRDFSYVARLSINDALPGTIIYKLILPPWHIEQDIIERILVPSISHSPQLYLAAHHRDMTALFLEDLGSDCLLDKATSITASMLGEYLARLHRSYCYRVDEIAQLQILKVLSPLDYIDFCQNLTNMLDKFNCGIASSSLTKLNDLIKDIAQALAHEPVSLVHGDFYAENIIINHNRLHFIDWSWFTMLSVPILDLCSVTMTCSKNGSLSNFKQNIIESYCYEAGRSSNQVLELLPFVQNLNAILFLNWLAVRKKLGYEATTVGPVNDLIASTIAKLINV